MQQRRQCREKNRQRHKYNFPPRPALNFVPLFVLSLKKGPALSREAAHAPNTTNPSQNQPVCGAVARTHVSSTPACQTSASDATGHNRKKSSS